MLAISSRMFSFKACMVRGFFSCTLAYSSSRKEKILGMSSLAIEGAIDSLKLLCLAVEQWLARWKREPLSTIYWGHSKLLRHCTGMNRQCFWNKFHLLRYSQKRSGRSIWVQIQEKKTVELRELTGQKQDKVPQSGYSSSYSYHSGPNRLLLLLLFSILSDDRSKASSKTIPPHSAIQSLLFQMRVSTPVLKVIQ